MLRLLTLTLLVASGLFAAECRKTPPQSEGPFYFDTGKVRTDIREDRDGILLDVRLRVLDGRNCEPIKGAVVALWHADALGSYSGYDDQESAPRATFLRGRSATDAEGRVQFTTIYPGGYPGRVPHIHFKVFTSEGHEALTSQFYFPEYASRAVFANAPYNQNGGYRLSRSGDFVLRAWGGGERLTMAVEKASRGYRADFDIVIAP